MVQILLKENQVTPVSTLRQVFYNKAKIISHKCNNFQKISEAIYTEILGVDGVEFDVVATKDAVPVLFHDRIIKEKVNVDFSGNGAIFKNLEISIEVSNLTAEELKNLRPDIQTLEEVFTGVDNLNFSMDFEFHLEIKPSESLVWDRINDILQKFPRINKQTIPRSFQENILQHIKQNSPDREICLLLGKNHNKDTDFPLSYSMLTLPGIERIKEICGGSFPKYVSTDYKIITNDFIDEVKAANMEVEIYTLNNASLAVNFNVDAIVTDVPKHFLK